jgi:hypothetical protein
VLDRTAIHLCGEEIMIREQLTGTWRLISWETRKVDGSISHPYGEQPVGQLMYDSAGNMSAAIMRTDRPKFSISDKFRGTSAEIQSAFEGFEAYFGTYKVNEEERSVSHHVEGGLLPNLAGATLKRFVELSDNRLTLSTPPISYGGETIVAVLMWERKSVGS